MGTNNIEEIYVTYSKQIYKYLFCLTRDDSLSEELTQETFFIAMKNINKFKGNCKLSSWLCQIAKHLYYKELKKHKNFSTIPLTSIEDYTNNSLEETSISKLYLYNKIDKLDERSKEIIYLRIMGNLSFKEIGNILGISENLARVTFYRGKQKIKEGDFDEKN